MIALDTNLLIYAHRSAQPEHRKAKTAIERASANRRGWGIPSPCVAEFWSVVTHPASEGRPTRTEEARAFIQALAEAGAQILTAQPDFAERLMDLADELQIVGTRVFDLQIGLLAREAGAFELWSHDRSFTRIPGLTIVDPL